MLISCISVGEYPIVYVVLIFGCIFLRFCLYCLEYRFIHGIWYCCLASLNLIHVLSAVAVVIFLEIYLKSGHFLSPKECARHLHCYYVYIHVVVRSPNAIDPDALNTEFSLLLKELIFYILFHCKKCPNIAEYLFCTYGDVRCAEDLARICKELIC